MQTHTTHARSVDRRTIISVVFEKETAEAAAPMLEVTFEYLEIEPIGIKGLRQVENRTPWTLNMLSATRKDTRETVTLTPEEASQARIAANDHAYYKIPED